METSENLTEASLSESISLPADSLARMSAFADCDVALEKEPDRGSMPTWSGLFASYDQATCSWRTFQVCLVLSDLESPPQLQEYLETWPRSGSMRNGNLYQRPPLVPRISVTGFGYLPTPDRSMGELKGGMKIEHDALVCFRKETTGIRPSGAKIGSSLRWCPEFIREWLRTGGGLNPEWIGRLMGFPSKWSAIKRSAMPSARKSRNGSANKS